MNDWDLNDKSLSKWQYFQHSKSIVPNIYTKEWQTMLRLHLVLVTLHMWLTISIEQDKIKLVTLNTKLNVVFINLTSHPNFQPTHRIQ